MRLYETVAVGGGFEPPTMQLASAQKIVVVNPIRCVCPLSSPPRQEGTSANFDTLQYKLAINPNAADGLCFG